MNANFTFIDKTKRKRKKKDLEDSAEGRKSFSRIRKASAIGQVPWNKSIELRIELSKVV